MVQPRPKVPVLNLRELPRSADALRQLDAACRQWGFFQIKGHGIDAALIAETHACMRSFFALSREEKAAIVRTSTNPWGYYDRELTKNKRDWKEIFDFGSADNAGTFAGARAQWPETLPRFEPAMKSFFLACQRVAYEVLGSISKNLGLSQSALAAGFGADHTSFLRLNHYPVCDTPSEQLGISPHTDAGALTVLLQDDVAGLEVLRGDVWYPVEPDPTALVINIGDIVQVWSNDRYAAPLHRVRANSAAERFSAPFFFNPAYATNYAPLVGEPRYRPINWGEFRAGRASGDYADRGQEIQISDFRL